MNNLMPCIGCGALVPDMDGPTFPYPDAASPGCWAVFGEILAREYGEYRYPDCHRLTVDAYAVQHPGRPTPQTIQSVTVHLVSLCLVIEKKYTSTHATKLMASAVKKFKHEFIWLEPPAALGKITVLDVVRTQDLAAHTRQVELWANSAWEAWAKHHAVIQEWVHKLEGR